MKICYTALYYDPAYSDPLAYLDRMPVIREIPQPPAARAYEVDVVFLFPTDGDGRYDVLFPQGYAEVSAQGMLTIPRVATRPFSNGACTLRAAPGLSGPGRPVGIGLPRGG